MKRKPPKSDLGDRINDEMRRLQRAGAILACVVAASEAEEKIDFGDAVSVALTLVRESVQQLDGMTLA